MEVGTAVTNVVNCKSSHRCNPKENNFYFEPLFGLFVSVASGNDRGYINLTSIRLSKIT